MCTGIVGAEETVGLKVQIVELVVYDCLGVHHFTALSNGLGIGVEYASNLLFFFDRLIIMPD